MKATFADGFDSDGHIGIVDIGARTRMELGRQFRNGS